ncbi:CDP-glucose 4,6-dehydratase [Oscillospiraceae bacterium 42-9]
MDLNFYKGKRVFITGHTGFKGAWLSRILVNAGADVTGYSLEPPTEPNLFTIAGLSENITSVLGDIRDRDKLMQVFYDAQPEIVFHLAAQPIVRCSYLEPAYTYETNVMGTVNILECVRTLQVPVKSAVIITTDKVYENKNWAWGYRENDPLDGYDPYSNSKSCAELVVHSYVNSFAAQRGLPVSTVRAGNVIGGGDFASERIIPDCVRAAQAGKAIAVRNPYSIRPYQHVLEALFAYLLVAQRQGEDRGLSGWYNIGPDDSGCVTTGELVDMFCKAWGKGLTWENRAERNAPHEDSFLKLDCSKIKTVFGWRPIWDVRTAIRKTVEWTTRWMENADVSQVMDRQIYEYLHES